VEWAERGAGTSALAIVEQMIPVLNQTLQAGNATARNIGPVPPTSLPGTTKLF
jgi:hypothetical protein